MPKSRDQIFMEAQIERFKPHKPVPVKKQENPLAEAARVAASRRATGQRFYEFIETVKESFMNEFIYKIFSESLSLAEPEYKQVTTEADMHDMVAQFIKEYGGVNKMLSDCETKTPLLSEAVACVTHYTDLVTEANKDKKDKNLDCCEFKIPQDVSTAFYKELDMADLGDVTLQISHRVMDGIDEFLTSNAALKANIDEIVSTAKQNIDNSKDEAQNEYYNMNVTRKINKLKGLTPRTVFECMLNDTLTYIMKEDSLRESYVSEGSFDVDRVVKTCKVAYTLLETVNTIRLADVNESYIMKSLNLS